RHVQRDRKVLSGPPASAGGPFYGWGLSALAPPLPGETQRGGFAGERRGKGGKEQCPAGRCEQERTLPRRSSLSPPPSLPIWAACAERKAPKGPAAFGSVP